MSSLWIVVFPGEGSSPMGSGARVMWLACAGCLLAALLAAGCGGTPQSASPWGRGPVIIFDIDTLRADRLGCYGHDRDTSPRMDAMASEGYRFEWVFSQAPKTSLSQGSIFTGLYPRNHGLVDDEDHLSASLTTMAEVFQGSGYRTAAFVDGGYMSRRYGFDQGFEVYEVHHRKGLDTLGPRVIQWLTEHADENFFLLIHTYDVHGPYDPPEPYRSMYLDDAARTVSRVSTQAVFDPAEASGHQELLNPYDLAHSLARYDGSIRFVDDWVGRILDVVEELGLDQRATLVFLSDHGEAFQEQGVRGHNRIYAPVTRIPLVIRPPGGAAPSVIPDTVQSIDIMPTLLEGVGLDLPSGLQGRSLVPLLRGGSLRPLPAFSENSPSGQFAVTDDDHHLVFFMEPESFELFEFRQDPLARRDLLSERPHVVEKILDIGERWQEAVQERGRPETTPRPLDGDAIEDLRALGYIQ